MASLRLCVAFIYHDRKFSSGCENNKVRVQKKNLRRLFLSRMFFQTIFDFDQVNLET